MILNVISMTMKKMILRPLKLVAVLEGEPFAGAFRNKENIDWQNDGRKQKRWQRMSKPRAPFTLSWFNRDREG